MTLDLDELERLEREATPGPWVDAPNSIYASSILTADGETLASGVMWRDSSYIVALRQAAPQLVAIARAAQTRSFVAQLTAPPIPALNPNPLPTPAEERSSG